MTPNEQPTHSAALPDQGAIQSSAARRATQVRVKALSRRARFRMLRHLLELDAESRRLRFGATLSDDLLARYVEEIDFQRDTLFGVYDWRLRLIGVGHLAFSSCRSDGVHGGGSGKRNIAELGLSVSASARGRGIGTKLFERAAIHCRNADIDTLTMHCLASNRIMMHIARKSGMEVVRDHAEADAWLKLCPADPASVMREAIEEHVATIDYTLKANQRASKRWFEATVGWWWR